MPDLSLDWFLFLLRLAFIVLLYLFLYQVVRVTFKDLISRAEQPIGVPARGPATAATKPTAPDASLAVVDAGASGLSPGFEWPIWPGTTIGRHPGNAIVLEDPSVSGEHAEIVWERGRWWVRDTGSTNGTQVNGVRVGTPAPLRPGDLVQFGRVSGRFQA